MPIHAIEVRTRSSSWLYPKGLPVADTSLRCGCLGEAVWFNQQDALLRQETPLKYSSRRPDSSSKAELGTVLPNWTEGDRETWNEVVVDAAEHDDVIQGFL